MTTVLSAALNASFYVSWMVASFIFVAPTALTMVLYAVGSQDRVALQSRLRLTLGVSALIAVLAELVLWAGAGLFLRAVGPSYAEQATVCLRILGLGALPLTIKLHFVALYRTDGRIGRAALVSGAGGLLEVLMAAAGAHWGGLTGLSLGWVLAMAIEAAFMAPAVYRAAFGGRGEEDPGNSGN